MLCCTHVLRVQTNGLSFGAVGRLTASAVSSLIVHLPEVRQQRDNISVALRDILTGL